MAKKYKNKPTEKRENARKQKVAKEKQQIAEISQKIAELDENEAAKLTKFADLPISKLTLKGLTEAGFIAMTDIQKQTLPLTLKGNDLLGAARTGSGKTLAFLIPLLEKLYLNSWNEYDGLGALVISPTRELAIQIYEVLVKIGKHHSFSAGLVIGGKDVKFEQDRVGKMNILVGTPGRLLQHCDQSASFDASALQMLILDEADRILDMGFKKSVDSIIESLPVTRQTMLFSATQTQSVNDLARLSLANPKKVDVEAKIEKKTPDSLQESVVIVELQDKLDTLWSFLKTHLKSKIIVFFACSKEVHFVHETFKKMQPGISLLKLHGRQKQTARMETTYKFQKASDVCLLATDVVARGLDFPHVDWVVQVDCPENAETYIHRAGRSARFGKTGRSLLFLQPSESAFLDRLRHKGIEPQEVKIRSAKKKSISNKLQAMCFGDPAIKYLGQKTFVAYFRSVYLMSDKEVFDVEKLPAQSFAKSLGLPGAPEVKIKGAAKAKAAKNRSRQLDEPKEKQNVTKYDKMFGRKNQDVLSEHYTKLNKEASDSDDDFMSVKRKDHEITEEELPLLEAMPSKRSLRKALSKKASLDGNPQKLRFDDDGVAHAIYELESESEFHQRGPVEVQVEQFVEKEVKQMQEIDVEDKEVAREKRQEKKRRRKELMAEAAAAEESAEEEEEEADFDEYEESDYEAEEVERKKQKRENDDGDDEGDDGVMEYEEPETLEDLEALTEKLIGGA